MQAIHALAANSKVTLAAFALRLWFSPKSFHSAQCLCLHYGPNGLHGSFNVQPVCSKLHIAYIHITHIQARNLHMLLSNFTSWIWSHYIPEANDTLLLVPQFNRICCILLLCFSPLFCLWWLLLFLPKWGLIWNHFVSFLCDKCCEINFTYLFVSGRFKGQKANSSKD